MIINKDSCFVYILQLSNKTFYCGITKDLNKRIEQHNSGMSISTRRNLPALLIWHTKLPSRKQAALLEKKIKNRGVRKYLRTSRNARLKSYTH